MKGRVSGNRKRLAAFVRQQYVQNRRGLPFCFRIDPPEPYNRQKELDCAADERFCLIAAKARCEILGIEHFSGARRQLKLGYTWERSLKSIRGE